MCTENFLKFRSLIWYNLENIYLLGFRLSDFLWNIQNNDINKLEVRFKIV